MAEGLAPKMEITGLEDLRQRLEDPEMLAAAMRVIGAQANRVGKKTAVEAITGGQGLAVRSIVGFYNVRAPNAEVAVKSLLPMAAALRIEEGRAPGDPPSLRALTIWMRAVGIGRPGGARILQAVIEARGVKGKRYLAAAMEVWQSSLAVWMEKAARRIERRWAKREAAGE
jgi:hypothetical protein